MVTHNCTGPGCVGCYAIANSPRFGEREKRDPQYEAYLRREQERYERGGR